MCQSLSGNDLIRPAPRMTARLRCALSAVLCAAGLLAVAACSSGSPAPKPSPADSFEATAAREHVLYPLFVQCLAQHSVPIWDKADGTMQVAPEGIREGWYKNGKVITNTSFYQWLGDAEGTYPMGPLYSSLLVNGQIPDNTPVGYGNLDWWVQAAATSGKWPQICGTLPKA